MHRSLWTSWRARGHWALWIVAALLTAFFVSAPAQAQTVVSEVKDLDRFGFVGDGYRDCGLRHVGDGANVNIQPKAVRDRRKTADITVDYSNDFTAQARDAFDRAVRVWETHISSSIEIRIDANRLDNPDPGVLGAAGPASFWIVQGDQERFISGAALTDALTGSDQEPDSTDIVARFNLDRDWHFGSGSAPPDKLDFTTVVLHEIGHGLNFLSLCRPTEDNSNQARCKFEDNNGNLVAGIFTSFLAEESGGTETLLTNENVYPNPSSELLDALTSDQLVYVGDNAEFAAQQSDGPVPPKIYAPTSYQPGSSISHDDEATYPTGSVNSLMTPNLAAGETVRLPGPLVCGQLIDLGWPVGQGCSFTEVEIREALASAREVTSSNQGTAVVSWRQVGNGQVDEYVIEQQFFDEPFQEVARVSADGPGNYSTEIEGLRVGTYRFRVGYATGQGTLVRGPTTDPISIQAQKPAIAVYPNPFTERVQVAFELPERQRVRVNVFDQLGRHVTTLFEGERPENDARPIVFQPDRLPSSAGVYFVRVEGETFSQTVKAVHVK